MSSKFKLLPCQSEVIHFLLERETTNASLKEPAGQCRRCRRHGFNQGRCPGGGHSNPLQHSSLENPHGQRSLAGYSPQGGKELKVTEATEHSHTHMIVQPFTKTSERLKCSVQKKGSLKRFKGMTYSSLQSRKLKCYPSASSAKAKNRNGSSQKDTWNWLLSNAVGPHDICRRSISFLRILYQQKQCQFG